MKKKLTAPFVTIVLATFMLTACGSTSPQTTDNPSAAPQCNTAPTGAAAFTTAALVQPGQSITSLSPLIVDVAAKHGGRLIIATVATTAHSTTVFDTALRGHGSNEFERNNSLTCQKKAAAKALDDAAGPPVNGTLDVFDALNALANTLGTTNTSLPVNVVIDSTMLSASTPVDLTDNSVISDPTAALNTLAANRLLPNCHGWNVSVVTNDGGSDGAALKEFWRQYFERCSNGAGGLVSWAGTLASFPSATVIAAADTTQIATETVGSSETITVPADALFNPGESTFLDGSDALLNKLLDIVQGTTGQIVATGYTDVGGGTSAASDDALGMGRSQAVLDWLEDKGISASRLAAPQSGGSSHPLYPQPTTELQHAANRRVVLTAQVAS